MDTLRGIDINLRMDARGLFSGTCAACGAEIMNKPVQPKVFAGHALFHRNQKHGYEREPAPDQTPSR